MKTPMKKRAARRIAASIAIATALTATQSAWANWTFNGVETFTYDWSHGGGWVEIGSNNTGILTNNYAGTVTIQNLDVGRRGDGTYGEYVQNAGTVNLTGELVIGYYHNLTGLAVINAGTMNVATDFKMPGDTTEPTASLKIGGGDGKATVTVKGEKEGKIYIRKGTVLVATNGTFVAKCPLYVGEASGFHGVLDVDGGEVTNTASYMSIAEGVSSTGTVTVRNGGKYYNTGTGITVVGASGAGTLDILSGGEVNIANSLRLCQNSGSSATVRIADGGLLTMPGIYDGVDGTATVTIDGGTIRANKNNETLIPNSSNLTVTVGANGGTIHSGKNAITIANAIGGTGGLTFTGGGTITLSGAVNYSGATAVTPGTILAIANSTAKTNILGTRGLVVAGVPIAGQTIATYTAALDDADLGKVSCSIAPATTFKFSDETKTAIVVDTVGPTSMFTIDANGVLTGVDLDGATEVVIPYGVTGIGYRAFYNCTGLTSVTIPGSVTNVGKSAFYECGGLTGVTIPDSVASIGEYAFYGCSNLTSVTIPDSVTNIGKRAFYGCSGLTGVTIGDGVASIGEYTFSGCSGLTSVTIPDSVTVVGKSAFAGCGDLTSVTIGNGVTGIAKWAFYGCGGLASVTIPDSVTSIGEYAFQNCGALTNVVFAGNAPAVGTDPFDGVASGFVASVSPKSTGWGGGETWNGLVLQYRNPYARFDETGGNSEWTVENDGSWKSGVINHSQNTWAEVPVQGPCVVSFEWKVSSESGYDKLHLYLDGGTTDKVPAISGEVDWTTISFDIDDSAEHTVRWTYIKDGSASNGSDCGWVRNFSVESLVSESGGAIDESWTFEYTGAVQTFTVPASGYYTLECYGAQGGRFVNADGLGGLGGKAQLTYHLTAGTVLYIYVGGQGGGIASAETDSDTEGGAGGWNGGGKGGTGARWHNDGIQYSGGAGGGGATHIATSAIGHITSSTDFTANHAGLLLIAGGGGGGTGTGKGGKGGGDTGENGSSSYIASWSIAWNNGTYSCGRDGEVSSTGSYSCCGCGGGGGGFQGGNTWHVTSSTAEYESFSGAGGSSWGDTANGTGYTTTTGGATAGGNGKARISPETYTITYNLDGGSASNPAHYNVTTATFTLNNPTREGYMFMGWTGSNGSTPQKTVTIAQGSTGNRVYTANWGGYEAWAEDNGIAGAWNETDASGIHNVFRYVFDVPGGAFTNPPLIDIAFEDGKVVIKTPPVANSEGVTVTVVESSDVAGKTVTATKAVDAAGSTEFTKSAESPRFYRLSAEVTE